VRRLQPTRFPFDSRGSADAEAAVGMGTGMLPGRQSSGAAWHLIHSFLAVVAQVAGRTGARRRRRCI